MTNEFDAFLECGILAHGFRRLRCGDCGHDKLVAFSCKRRGFCPSCGARRMAQTAAHLVDQGIPHVPVRQWALAGKRVQTNVAGQVVLKLKTPWRDGSTHLVMSPLEFMQRLAHWCHGREVRRGRGELCAPSAGAAELGAAAQARLGYDIT